MLKCHLILQLLPYSNYLDIFNMTEVHWWRSLSTWNCWCSCHTKWWGTSNEVQWWGKHESMLSIVEFFACQIQGIVRSQIETKRTFFFNWDTSNLRSCHLQVENLNKLVFVNNKWLKDPKIGCISPFNVVELI